MTDIMNKSIVLQLNANWMPIGYKTVKEAIISMTSYGDQPPALALDISYTKNEDGSYDFNSPEYLNPLTWDKWISSDLPIRDFDVIVRSATLTLRAPTVIIAPNYREMPMRTIRPTKFNVFERDKGICQYTGKKLNRKDGNIDHIKPQSKGGKDTWENMVWCDKTINSIKGNKTPSEAGLRLQRQPKAPPPVPVSFTITDVRHPTWQTFLVNSKL